MLDHFNIPVSDIEQSAAFYVMALEALEVPLLMKDRDAIGFGKTNWEFGIVQENKAFPPLHVAFSATSHDEVSLFYQAAIKAGGVDNGAPMLRTQYGPSYYSAYILDPDGHNIEAVCRSE